MYILGLTGPIASGKSTVSKMFKAEGVPVISADDIVHDCYSPNTPVNSALVDLFGKEVLQDDGYINRKKLSEIIRQNPDSLEIIEGIVHPQVRRVMKNQLNHAYSRTHKMIVLDVPLMFESNFNILCDSVATCSCNDEKRHRRFLERPDTSEVKWQFINAKQLPSSEYIERSDHIISTDSSELETQHKVLRLIEQLSGEEGHAWHDKWQQI